MTIIEEEIEQNVTKTSSMGKALLEYQEIENVEQTPRQNENVEQTPQQNENVESTNLSKVTVDSDNIEVKVSHTKNLFISNPTATIKNVKKMLLDRGFNSVNDDELEKIIKQATNSQKYKELYPQLEVISGYNEKHDKYNFLLENAKKTPLQIYPQYIKKFPTNEPKERTLKSLKDKLYSIRKKNNIQTKRSRNQSSHQLTDIQRKFLKDNRNYNNDVLLSMFNKEYPNDPRKLTMITVFFKSGNGKNMKREIIEQSNNMSKTKSINKFETIKTKTKKSSLSKGEFEFFINNDQLDNMSIQKLYRKTFPESKRTDGAIIANKDRAKSGLLKRQHPEFLHVNPHSLHHTNDININTSNNQHVLKERVIELLSFGISQNTIKTNKEFLNKVLITPNVKIDEIKFVLEEF